MITENGLTAELACVTACRPAWPGHNNSSVNPLLFTIHDIEDGRSTITSADTDLMIGPAGSDSGIMGDNWLDQASVQSSVHFGVYPGGVAQCLSLSLGCWGAGAHANYCAIQAEQSGVASYTAGQWLTPDGLAQLNNLAELYAELCVHFGWPQPHWATDAEITACASGDQSQGFGGATYHSDWSRLFPNDTTHTDPGDNYPGKSTGAYVAGQADPQDQFMPLARAKWAALTGNPTPTPTPTTGDSPMSATEVKQLSDKIDALAALIPSPTANAAAVWGAHSGLSGALSTRGAVVDNTQQILAHVRDTVNGLSGALTGFVATVKASLAAKK